ncbi:hypothetical protein C0V82_03885 [Niveispirillum cyanobacteriorum]|uniref:Uncharacterized protein n=1 Tax=Niveispirillum cyanobacteriorum TaxID=1612173 RepID=A0A2K9N8K1_9PROT|nr:hypothetical protein C0V82_03885 [Niveispirillum cyanobacteriorum]
MQTVNIARSLCQPSCQYRRLRQMTLPWRLGSRRIRPAVGLWMATTAPLVPEARMVRSFRVQAES